MKEWKLSNGAQIIQVLSGRSNAYIIQSGSTVILVDTGKKSARSNLNLQLREHGISRIDWLILTHTHFDHCQNAAFLKKEFDCKIIVSKNATQNIAKGFTPLSKGTNRYSKLLLKLDNIMGQKRWSFEPFKVDEYISDETILDLNNIKVDIYPTPGHSSDSISMVVNHEIALVGDTMFGVLAKSVFPPFADEPHRLSAHWEKLYDTGCITFLPGHGQPISRKILKACILKTPNER